MDEIANTCHRCHGEFFTMPDSGAPFCGECAEIRDNRTSGKSNFGCAACRAGSRLAQVSWGDDSHRYTGRISDYTWNGFCTPAFTREEVVRMANNTAGVEGLCQIQDMGDSPWGHSFQIVEPDAEWDEGFSARVFAEPCCGLYFIGDWWTWGEIEPRPESDAHCVTCSC
jgi:hypothetical protein